MAESYSVTPESVGLKLNRDPLLANLDGRSNVTPVENQSDRLFNDPTIGGGIEYKQEGPSKRFNIEASKEVPLLRSDNLNLDANVRGGAWESTSSQDAFIVNEKGQRIGASVSGNIILNNEGTARLRGRLDKDFTNVGMKSVSPLGNYKGQDGNTYTKWDLGLDVGPLGVDFGEKAVTYTLGNNGKFYFNKDSVGVKYERKFNKGGTPMIKKQMEMFEDGGLKDQGGTVDPMSGNDVPVGSTQKEVRDDIPAQLSEGEFVFPADVVRFIGLEKLMGLRQQAKMGLKKMEQMGQMGNSDEATMPDDMPFGISDLIVVSPEGKEVEMAEGGVIQAATGVNVTPSNNPTMTNVQRANNPNTSYVPYTTASSVVPLPTQPVPTKPVVTPNTTPSFGDVMGDAKLVMRQYKNAAGYVIMIPHVGDKDIPIYPVPEGYYLVTEDGTTPSMPSTGTGETAPAETVKPEEGDREAPDLNNNGIPDNIEKGLRDASSNMASIASGQKTPSALEKFMLPYYTNIQMKILDIPDSGNPIENERAVTLANLQNQMKQTPNKITNIKGEEIYNPEFNKLADSLANLREYTRDENFNSVPTEAHPSRKTSIPTTSPFYNQPSSRPTVTTSDKTENIKTVTPDKTSTSTGSSAQDDANQISSFMSGEGEASTARSGVTGGPAGVGGVSVGEAGRGGGPDRGGDAGGFSGNAGFSGDYGGAGSGSPDFMNKGGLAGKKPKKKATRKMKKGGLATSKK